MQQCNEAEYSLCIWIQDKGQRPKAPRGWSLGRGCAPSLPGKFLMIYLEMAHFDAYLRYSEVLILSSAVPAYRSAEGAVPCASSQKIIYYYKKLASSWRCERTAALHRSPQNNVFGAIVVQFWCILSYIRLPVLKQSKNFLGDWGPRPPSKYAHVLVYLRVFLRHVQHCRSGLLHSDTRLCTCIPLVLTWLHKARASPQWPAMHDGPTTRCLPVWTERNSTIIFIIIIVYCAKSSTET